MPSPSLLRFCLRPCPQVPLPVLPAPVRRSLPIGRFAKPPHASSTSWSLVPALRRPPILVRAHSIVRCGVTHRAEGIGSWPIFMVAPVCPRYDRRLRPPPAAIAF